jgi:hypothetical protein
VRQNTRNRVKVVLSPWKRDFFRIRKIRFFRISKLRKLLQVCYGAKKKWFI